MPTRRLYEGRARPLFFTEGLGNPQAEALITQYGYDLAACEKIQNLWYLIMDESFIEVDIAGGVSDIRDSELTRDGDYIYTVMTNKNGNNRGGQLTAAFANGKAKADARYDD